MQTPTLEEKDTADLPNILQRIAGGDKSAVSDCLDTYGKLIWALAKRFGGTREDMEDAVVEIFQGQILYGPDEPIEHVYFPNDSTVSVVAMTADGQCVESAVIGLEGMAGINVLMGVDSMPNEIIIQIGGGAMQMTTAAIRKEFKRSGAMQDLLLRFTHALMIQIGQTTLCNRLHSIDERLSRWLLMCHDRSASDQLKLTQEFISIMLGANRARVTMSAIALQNAGFIKYARGNITITNRAGLENFTCACYKAVREEYGRYQR